PQRPVEMKVLDRIVGDWRNEITVRNADTPLQREAMTVLIKARPLLAGRFIEAEEANEVTGKKDYRLAWYDSAQKKYRFWLFSSPSAVSKLNGTWDENRQTIHWKAPDNTVEGHWTFENDDRRETPFTIKDRTGKWLVEVTGVCKRLR